MTWLKRTLCFLAMTLLVTACASPAPPDDRFYRLSAKPDILPLDRPVLPGVLEVSRLDSDGVIVERSLVYTREDGALARYRYDFWSDPPARMMHEALTEALARSAVSKEVTVSELRNLSDWIVRGRLQRFEQVDRGTAVVVRLVLALSSARDGNILLMKIYEVKEPMAAPTPEETVQALSRASGKAINLFLDDIRALPVQQQPRGRG